jgi:hypothetical protein
VLQMREANNLHLLAAIAPEIHVDALREEVLETEGSAEAGDGFVGTVGVEDGAADVVGAVGRDGDLQDLTGLSLAEDGECALRLQLAVAECRRPYPRNWKSRRLF